MLHSWRKYGYEFAQKKFLESKEMDSKRRNKKIWLG
jgi:hypothetical protein